MIMVYFPSLQIQNMFTKGHLTQYVRASHLQGTQNYRKLQLALSSLISLINQNGGWTIYGLGKRDIINDVSLLCSVDGEDKKVVSKEVKTNVVHLRPTNTFFSSKT